MDTDTKDGKDILLDTTKLYALIQKVKTNEAACRRVRTALQSQPPAGVSRIDWIAKQLNATQSL
jgi:hypothetical protein